MSKKRKWKKYCKRLLKENIMQQNKICQMTVEIEGLKNQLEVEKERFRCAFEIESKRDSSGKNPNLSYYT